MSEMERLIKKALKTPEEPSSALNQKVLQKAKEQMEMKKKYRKTISAAAALALTLLVGGGTAYAAWNYLHPSQVAREIGSDFLAKVFESEGAIEINETQKFKDYAVTLLGMADSNGIASLGLNVSVEKDKLYTVVAIKKTDGTSMPEPSRVQGNELDFLVSPLIKGENPEIINGFCMNLSSASCVKDGVLYCISSCDELEVFADRKVYLAVLNNKFYDADAYVYDEKSGAITRNEAYQGINALFSLPFNKEKADEKAGESLLASWENSENNSNIEKEQTETLTEWSKSFDKEQSIDPYKIKVFDDQICVAVYDKKKDCYLLNFYVADDGEKLVEVKIPDCKGNICSLDYVDGYVVWKEQSADNGKNTIEYTIYNDKYEICDSFTLPTIKNVEWNGSNSVVLPKEKKLVYWNEAEDTNGFYFEICRCTYDGSEKEQLYKIYTTKESSTNQVMDIDSAMVSQDGKSLFFVASYMEIIEPGASSKTGAGVLDLESGDISFEVVSVDTIEQVNENQAIFRNNLGLSKEIIIMDSKGNYQSVKTEDTMEQSDTVLFDKGDLVVIALNVYKKNGDVDYQILKGYDVETGKVQWRTKLDKGEQLCCLRSKIGQDILLGVYKSEKEYQNNDWLSDDKIIFKAK